MSGFASKTGVSVMGDRGKDDEMKSRSTNLDPVQPDSEKSAADKPETKDSMARQDTPHKPDVRLGREVQARIGQQLRAMYDDFVNQGVPGHINDLLRKISDQDQD